MVKVHVWWVSVCMCWWARTGAVMWHMVGCVACTEAVSGLCALCVAVISLGGNRIGAEGAAAIGAGLHGVPSLTSLEYVMQAWVMCMMGERTGGVV